MGKRMDAYRDTMRMFDPQGAANVDKTQAETRGVELRNKVAQMKIDNRKATQSLAAATSDFMTGNLSGMVENMGKVYKAFPDGGQIGKVHSRSDGMVVDITDRDGIMHQELVTHENAQNYLKKGRDMLDPQAFMNARMNLDAEKEAFNHAQKGKPQQTVDGNRAYKQMDNNGNYFWIGIDAEGKETRLKTKPKLLAEKQAAEDRALGIRKTEAGIGKDVAQSESYRATARKTEAEAENMGKDIETPKQEQDYVSKWTANQGITLKADTEGTFAAYSEEDRAEKQAAADRDGMGLKWKPVNEGEKTLHWKSLAPFGEPFSTEDEPLYKLTDVYRKRATKGTDESRKTEDTGSQRKEGESVKDYMMRAQRSE